MELKLVNDNKLKITLTNEDMTSMDITCEEIDYDNDTGTRRVFWDILDKAKHETGFDAAGDKIFVEVYPDKGGGCFMYVTKINSHTKTDYTTYEKKYKPKLYTATKKKRILYSFSNSEYLCDACKQLSSSGYSGKSDIFADSNTYYLYIEDNKDNVIHKVSEYGYLINNPFFGFYLNEHSKKIVSDDAVNIFCSVY